MKHFIPDIMLGIAVALALCLVVRAVRAEEPTYSVRMWVASDGPAIIPTPTPTPELHKETEPAETPSPLGWGGEVTHYGVSFEGLTMACGGTYHTWDTSIVAVPYPSRNAEWPCGQAFTITGPTGQITAYRTDSCPGCHHYQLDLSEAGMLAVCGYLGRCEVWIRPH